MKHEYIPAKDNALTKLQSNDLQERVVTLHKLYNRFFRMSPACIATAPGRVNLIGEHVDYPDCQWQKDPPAHLYSLGFAIDRFFLAGIAPVKEKIIDIIHLETGGRLSLSIAELTDLEQTAAKEREAGANPEKRTIPAWANHTLAVICNVWKKIKFNSGMALMLSSTIPFGSGMSNSAANCIAVTTVLKYIFPGLLHNAPIDIVRFARDAENSSFVGGCCGWLDQLLIQFSRKNRFSMIDYADNNITRIKNNLPPESKIVTVNTNVPHTLSESDYSTRVRELALLYNLLSRLTNRHITATAFSMAQLNELINIFAPREQAADLNLITKIYRYTGTVCREYKNFADLKVLLTQFIKKEYQLPSLSNHKSLSKHQSFAVLLKRMRHQKQSSLLVPAAAASVSKGDSPFLNELLNTEGSSLRMSGDFAITGTNMAQDTLLDIGLDKANRLGLSTAGRMLGGGG
ncbi:MAG TPA: galactokinase family protein, partial [Spirochaetota bacterium]|nr:galactokinase family protein [Spirochaetota bacterium]